MHIKNIVSSGAEVAAGTPVLILLHGRGGSAEDILSLSDHLDVSHFALLAPQATGNTWYPYTFLSTPEKNEPWLSSALGVIDDIVNDLIDKGIASTQIYYAGFSQGACLTLEYMARHARPWGGVVAFTGGLIGDRIYKENYTGDFGGTPFFIGSADPDPHVPVERVKETERILTGMHASVTVKIYPGMGHTINTDEIRQANEIVFSRGKQP